LALGLAGQRLGDELPGDDALVAEGLAHGGQWRAGVRRRLDVVEPDDREVGGHCEAELVGGGEGSEGELVGLTDQGGRARSGREEGDGG
jgi:hypothetical protein